MSTQKRESVIEVQHNAEGYRAWARFLGEQAQISAARQWVLGTLPSGCAVRDDVALLVTELAANAWKHTASNKPGGSFEITVQDSKGSLRIEVADQGSPTEPTLKSAGFDLDLNSDMNFDLSEAGRGLQLVDGLADRWGVDGDATGRTVWVELSYSERTSAESKSA